LRKPIVDINVTSLVDVMMVLLIIFMITAPMLRSSINVVLPKAQTQDTTSQEGIIVSITRDSFLYINGEKIPTDKFDTILMKKYITYNQKTILIEADTEVAYGIVVKVMDRIKRLGINQVGLIVDSEKSR
jgi:biopolymer transport protein TolR